MVTLLKRVGLISASLASPMVCMASPPYDATAVRNCAHAEAQRLRDRIGALHDQLTMPIPGPLATRVPTPQTGARQMIVRTHNDQGRSTQMLCTYDRHGRVVKIRTATDATLGLDLDR